MVCGSKLYSTSVDEISNENYFPLVLLTFVTLCKVVLSFESVDKILEHDHSNESYWTVLNCCDEYGREFKSHRGQSLFLQLVWATFPY